MILRPRKIATSILVFVVIFSTQHLTALAANFSDVPATHANSTAIQTLKDAGLVSGYPSGNFKPEQKVTRAEALAMILKAAGITSAKTSSKMPFKDVGENDWFYPMIQKGVALGKLKGYEDKTFRPNKTVTLPEALALTTSFFQIDIKKLPVDAVIYDGLNTKDWYSKQAQYSKNKNLIEPDAKGHVDPFAELTRGELAEIIYRARSVQQTGKAFDITKNWVEIEYKENFWKVKYPADWELFKGLRNSVLWKKNGQAFFTRVLPTTARVSISVVDNAENLTATQYFSKLKADYTENYKDAKPIFADISISSRPALKITIKERRMEDLVIQLSNNNFLMIYGEYGDAPIGEFLAKQVDAILMSYQYVEKPPEPPKPVIPLEDRLGTLRENILVPDKWKATAELFPDKKLISTDAIGIGTGPVDYYYSKEANQTIKLERNSGTILNIREGGTTAF
ncbi:S-layer homology domain-containing protein [Candidatus Peregrinibacteria bacterium]|nr:S-layer homology domain-containing protein [Candidatus Peregrinibacteria bacterium]